MRMLLSLNDLTLGFTNPETLKKTLIEGRKLDLPKHVSEEVSSLMILRQGYAYKARAGLCCISRGHGRCRLSG